MSHSTKPLAETIIKRALVSVTDKTGIVDFCRTLSSDFGVEILSTGGTAQILADEGIPVTAVEEVTGFPEMMNGRVKTLHPKIHGALLARRDNQAHMDAAAQHDIEAIDLVVVNLYAFEAALAKVEATKASTGKADIHEEIIENIDIGGPSMLRSAAKNFASVSVVTNPESYPAILKELRENAGATTLETRKKLAQETFTLTSRYDTAIAHYFAGQDDGNNSDSNGSGTDRFSLDLRKVQDLRYGENPHQAACFYAYHGDISHTLAAAQQLQGKELSYNNILDTDAAWSAVRELTDPSCVIVKHTNPCGAATDTDIVVAYQKAWQGDPLSAFGGIIALNRPVTAAVVEAIFTNKQFVEVIIAPDFEPSALELLRTKPNMRVLKTGGVNVPGGRPSLRSVEGGVLIQDEDTAQECTETFTVAGTISLEAAGVSMADLTFAWKVCKSIKSNAIVLAKDEQMRGMGAGQPNRVNSARIAIEQANREFTTCEKQPVGARELSDTDVRTTDDDAGLIETAGSAGCVAASDAFIPFPDTVEVLAAAGIKAVIQPGGSIRDKEVLEAADSAGIAMVFTATRHFRH